MVEQSKNFMVQAGATWVLWFLFALSVASLSIMLDRALAFWSKRDDIASLVRDLHTLLGQGEVAAARERLEKSRSTEAAVVLSGLDHWQRGRSAAEEAMAAATGIERARLERRLSFLGTVGANAPFVGLLGTVIGIVGAFDELGRAAPARASALALAPERVMSTIAEALVATAVGLCVAIPAVAVFNSFQGKLAETLGNAETLGHVLLAHVRPNALDAGRES
ncbi:MAG TPA: MotA/TolQ/ExbB proton channel family protein [Polyangiaceae bacterium]|nr:MotA/TolQ/ExbB proton channel family protein [Polyangiaceae bacterium]